MVALPSRKRTRIASGKGQYEANESNLSGGPAQGVSSIAASDREARREWPASFVAPRFPGSIIRTRHGAIAPSGLPFIDKCYVRPRQLVAASSIQGTRVKETMDERREDEPRVDSPIGSGMMASWPNGRRRGQLYEVESPWGIGSIDDPGEESRKNFGKSCRVRRRNSVLTSRSRWRTTQGLNSQRATGVQRRVAAHKR